MKLNLLFAIVFPISYAINAQENTNISLAPKKKLSAYNTTKTITIDGKLDEPEWGAAQTATDFIMFEPDNGKPLAHEKRTEVKVLYDNEGIYIGALMYDDPQKILKEITEIL